MSSEAAPPPAEESLAAAQVDGSGPAGNGSTLREPEREVEVKLADLQADPNNPLFSVRSFEELQLYVALQLSPRDTTLTPAGPTSYSRAFGI